MTSIPLPSLPRKPIIVAIALAGAVATVLVLLTISPDFGHIGLFGLLGAIICTAISFGALGQYDMMWHRITDTGAGRLVTHRAGMAGIAIGQTLGASSITSALVRRRALPDLSHMQITKVSAGVALSFSACWSLLALGAMQILPTGGAFIAPTPLLTGILAFAVGVALYRLTQCGAVKIPDALRMLLWTSMDLLAAGTALFVLLPATIDVSFVGFLAIFVLAIGASILSHLPGGIGVFEVILLACLPHSDTGAVLGAIVAFRVVYYVIPFGIAIAWMNALSRAPKSVRRLTAPPPLSPAAWGLAPQSGSILSTPHGAFHIAHAPFSSIALGDPLGADPLGLQSIACQTATLPAFYKCTARLAATLRRHGWSVLTIAYDAVITPQTWSTSGRCRQGLRRKLRAAQAANVMIERVAGALPLADMTRIAARWAARNGGEMGFSMGRFDPDHVLGQEVFLIHVDNRLCGFVTFHRGPQDWALDLMRHEADLPDGAMHLAIATAIAAARDDHAHRLSLAAVPTPDGPLGRLCRSRAGLLQFKRSFGPQWEPLYHAAPNALILWVTGLAVAWMIHRPMARLIMIMRNHPVASPFLRLFSRPRHANARQTPDALTARKPHDERSISTA